MTQAKQYLYDFGVNCWEIHDYSSQPESTGKSM